MPEKICNSNCAECNDEECKAIEVKTFHKIKWTKELKLALHKNFKEIYFSGDDENDGI